MNIQAHPCIGGKSIGEDIRRLEAGVHIVSGTPGRVFDMIRRRDLRTDGIKLLLLDEVRFLFMLLFLAVAYLRYRLMNCSTMASRTKFTTFIVTCLPTHRSALSPPP